MLGTGKELLQCNFPLAFLAPDLIEGIVIGRQPIELTPRRLKRATIPPRWEEQRPEDRLHPLLSLVPRVL